MYLERVSGPADLKQMSVAELESLAREIRDEIYRVTSQNGGHFASNLGSLLVFAVVASPWWLVGLCMGVAQFAGAQVGSRLKAEMNDKATPELRTAIERVEPIFTAARANATNADLPIDARLAAIALLGRGRQNRDSDAFMERIRQLQDELASYPKTGLKADKAFYDSLNDE